MYGFQKIIDVTIIEANSEYIRIMNLVSVDMSSNTFMSVFCFIG